MLRKEFRHGHLVLVGQMLPLAKIRPGQTWQSTGGGALAIVRCVTPTVTLYGVDHGWLEVSPPLRPMEREKVDAHAFQCRYNLVLDENARLEEPQ